MKIKFSCKLDDRQAVGICLLMLEEYTLVLKWRLMGAGPMVGRDFSKRSVQPKGLEGSRKWKNLKLQAVIR
jgi:hypothetical protein